MPRARLILSFLLPLASALHAQAPVAPAPVKEFTASRIAGGQRPVVDARLDEAAWRTAVWRDDFLQKVPAEGGTPSGRTELAFMYDEDALYVGARMYSANPGG